MTHENSKELNEFLYCHCCATFLTRRVGDPAEVLCADADLVMGGGTPGCAASRP
jgi:hypothetical protein